tara:strand:+ start:1670 stop:1972 length:303 start_codon:yes stop_codon:yes gene_type:complete
MSNNSFKNLQNKLQKFVKDIRPDEPKRRKDAIKYIDELIKIVHPSYLLESPSDYMFLQTLKDAVVETKYFGGFTKTVKGTLVNIEGRYNYNYEEDNTNFE